MDAREATALQAEGGMVITARVGALMLPLAVLVLAGAEVLHPHREDAMDFRAAFTEYALSHNWTTVHLAEYFGFLLLLGGLVALYYSLSLKPGAGAWLAPFGLAAAVTTAASYTVLQAVDGIALKRAVDAWAGAPASGKAAAFAAAEAIRWTEMGMNGLSFFLAGLTLFLFGLAIALGSIYPRWVGMVAAVSGAAFVYDGVGVVAYEGFVPSTIKLVGLLSLAVWAFVMAPLMWRNGDRRRVTRSESAPQGSARRPAGARWF